MLYVIGFLSKEAIITQTAKCPNCLKSIPVKVGLNSTNFMT